VQSISEWAPVCIGPYAQANTLEGVLIYVAGECSESLKFAYSLAIGYQFRSIIIGQIPLDPASMQIIRGIREFNFPSALLALVVAASRSTSDFCLKCKEVGDVSGFVLHSLCELRINCR
jgi:hypothetical protein